MVMVVMAIIIIVLTGAMIIIKSIIFDIDVRIISNALKLLLIHYDYH